MLNKFKSLFAKNNTHQLQTFMPIIENNDPVAISLARDRVNVNDIDPLVAHYWTLDNWSQKLAIVELLQDHHHPSLSNMMLDFLRAPADHNGERTELGKAVALRYFAEKYDRFMTYYNDRALLARDVAEVLQANGMEAEKSASVAAVPQPTKPVVDPNSSLEEQLMDAAIVGDLDVVKSAVNQGANVNIEMNGGDYDGCSTLIMALMNKRFEVAEYLILNGANVNHTRPGHKKDRAIGQSPIWWVAARGTIHLGELLLERGAKINVPDHHKSRALDTAASNGRLPMVKFLIENGADIDAQIYDGRTAFNLACTNGHTDVAAYLISQGSDPNYAGDSGYTPLMIAAENNYYDLAKLLIDANADVNSIHAGNGIYSYYRGWTPLAFSLNASLVRMTKLLIKANADVYYRVPAGQNYDGTKLPEKGMMEMIGKKRAENLQKLLREAGLT